MEKLSLEARLKAEMTSFSGHFAFYANDFNGNIVAINADETFESASCIKLFILIELYRQIHNNDIDPNQLLEVSENFSASGSGILKSLEFGAKLSIKNISILMIVISDNIATNMLIDLLGIDKINQSCRELGFKNTILHNKIDFSVSEVLGTTTAKEYGQAFEKIYKNEIWNKDCSRQILNTLKNQHYNTLLSRDFPQYYLNSEDTGEEELIYLASKSGSMDTCRNDGGIIQTPYGAYVVTIFTKDFKDPLYYGDHESYRFGPKLSRLIFDQYLALKGRFE